MDCKTRQLRFERGQVQHGRRHEELRARLDLVCQPAPFGLEIGRERIDRDANVKSRRRPDRLPADIESAIEPRDHVDETDRVHVEHGRRVGVRPLLRRIARCQQDVAQSQLVRTDQIRLHADQMAIAAGVVQQRLDGRLLLDERRQGQCARAGTRPRVVRHVDGDRPEVLEPARAADGTGQVQTAGRRHFRDDRELMIGKRARQRATSRGDRRRRRGGACSPTATGATARTAAGAIVRTARAICRM